MTSTTFSSWKATLNGNPTEADFGAIQYTNYNTSAGLTLDALGNPSIGFTFTGPSNGSYSLVGTTYTGFKSLEGGIGASSGVNVATPAAGENAILFSLATSGNTPINVSLSDGETFTVNNGLLGLSISHPVTNITLSTAAGSQVIVDDFWYGVSSLTQDSSTPAQTAAPEASSFLMIPGGMLLIAGAIRRLRPLSAVRESSI